MCNTVRLWISQRQILPLSWFQPLALGCIVRPWPLCPLVKLGGAGATIPLPGFGHTLVTGMLEDAAKIGPFGILTGGLRATSSGLLTAILFGYLMAVLFNPKG